jgi:hypothetical protein
LRAAWLVVVAGGLDGERLVLGDEMGTYISLYAYAPRGERAFFEIPGNHGMNTTLLSSLHTEGVVPSVAVEGASIREAFDAYGECFLAPVLKP